MQTLKIHLYHISKKNSSISVETEGNYIQRIQKYIPFDSVTIAPQKDNRSLSVSSLQQKESEMILSKIPPGIPFYLLDEKGKEYHSKGFAQFINKTMSNSSRDIYFLIGGAYGFDDIIRSKSNGIISLSKLTLPHQLARLMFLEQLYRAFSILHNQPYHHD
ncbi:MAG: 23S rRNA (pseudouridine(1915)-N(3))-methyltransferase RlmH [Chitinophagales bacterium]|nr:23S rRNA (pseudouridine(1915)-N(3))-methyltransferase RlmH [Chitinophagales bacterium]